MTCIHFSHDILETFFLVNKEGKQHPKDTGKVQDRVKSYLATGHSTIKATIQKIIRWKSLSVGSIFVFKGYSFARMSPDIIVPRSYFME